MCSVRLSDILTKSAQRFPEKRAVQYLDRSMTYNELLQSASRTANALRRDGVMPGDKVCIVCRNGLQYLVAMFAISFVGAAPALLNWRMAPVAILQMIRQTGTRMVFLSNTEDETLSYLKAHDTDDLEIILTAHDPSLPSSFDAFSAGMSEQFEPVQGSPEDDAIVMFTSGTTGKAKGVAISDRAVRSQLDRLAKSGLWHSEDVFLCMSPLCHAISVSVMALLDAGGTLLLCPPEYIRDCHKVLEIIEKEHVTSTALVPTVINRLVGYMEDNGLKNTCVKFIHYGGSPMSQDLLERCGKVFSCRFNQGYGMTETYGTVVRLRPEDHYDGKHLQSVGRPDAGNEVKVVDEDGNTVAAGRIGEFYVKTPSVMSRYLGMPERTAEVLRDGWYHTGDMGYLDGEGFLFLKDRKSDMIITGGENVYPQEVENCILELKNDVQAVCVCGVDDPVWGEIIAAAVVRAPGSAIGEKDIQKHCADNLGRYKRPKQMLFVDAIPTTVVGKIDRSQVKALFKASN